MRPRKTKYRLAQRGDYRKAHKLTGWKARMSWPTVVAERDGELIGVIGTHARRDAVVAGFLYAPHPIVALRLIEAYERVLRLAGVREYWFSLAKDAPERWRRVVEENPDLVEPRGERDGVSWFKRKL